MRQYQAPPGRLEGSFNIALIAGSWQFMRQYQAPPGRLEGSFNIAVIAGSWQFIKQHDSFDSWQLAVH